MGANGPKPRPLPEPGPVLAYAREAMPGATDANPALAPPPPILVDITGLQEAIAAYRAGDARAGDAAARTTTNKVARVAAEWAALRLAPRETGGYDRLIAWSDAPIMPTPGAVGDILQRIAARDGLNAVCVDIGGATTDVFSVFGGTFNRTVSANLGMSYSISNVCAEAGMDNVLRWVHIDMDERELRNRVKNKMIRPTTIPQSAEALVFEQAVAREALRLAYVQHKEFATTLKGVQQQRTVGDLFAQQASGQTIVDDMRLDLLVASGGVLSHAPRMEQTAAMLVDSFEPRGFTQLAKDSIFMMPHLGVLASVHAPAAMEVFERDCLVRLGWSVAAAGEGKWGRKCFTYRVSGAVNASGELACGDVALVRVGPEQEVEVVVEPAKEFDLGAGPGKPVARRVKGGTVGILFDARGRPLALPDNAADRKAAVARWAQIWETR
jgi:hypothetical protein